MEGQALTPKTPAMTAAPQKHQHRETKETGAQLTQQVWSQAFPIPRHTEQSPFPRQKRVCFNVAGWGLEARVSVTL